jgi:hypothetical protein
LDGSKEVYCIGYSKFEQIVNKKSFSLLIRMDAKQRGFRDNLFERILYINMLEHILKLFEIFRIRRKGWRVIPIVPCTDGKVEDYTRTCKIYNPRTI